MKEEDLVMARAIVAESMENGQASPGGSPAPLKKTLITKVQDKASLFRWVNYEYLH